MTQQYKTRLATVIAAAAFSVAAVGAVQAHTKKADWHGPGAMSASADGQAIWQFPDMRALDPALFGTPEAPLNTDLLPMAMRATSEDGTSFTTTAKPMPFSNKIAMTSGNFNMQVRDLSAQDGMGSKDQIDMEANFAGPDGKQYRVVVKRVIPKGPEHQFFGGVGTNVLMHGGTGIGTPLVAQEFSYITAWGIGDFYVDGEKVDSGRVVHLMVSQRTRDDDFKVGFGVAKPDELEVHLMLPPLKVSPSGPVPSALPTGLTLPNGMQQPFVHVNFYGNAKVRGNQFLQGAS
jgi:hypothetical protein